MRSKFTYGTVAATLLLLTACAGSSDDEHGIASRLARAATKSVVNAVIEVDHKSSRDEGQTTSAAPLRLASSRPDSILDMTPGEVGAPEVSVETRHVVIATILPDFTRRCGEQRLEGDSIQVESSSTSATVACPLTRSRAGHLTRI